MPFIDLEELNLGIITGTTHATPGTTTSHAHNGGIVPRGYFILPRGNGIVYEITAPDATNISVRGSAASIPFTALILF